MKYQRYYVSLQNKNYSFTNDKTKDMNRNFIIVLLMLLLPSGMMAADSMGPQLIVWLKSGERVVYELADAPVTTFEGEQLIIRTNTVTIPYDRRNVLRYTYENLDTGIDLLPSERRVQINHDGNEVIFRGLQNGAKVCIYSINGQLVEQRGASGEQKLTISLQNRPTGVYIIKTGKETIKIIKK